MPRKTYRDYVPEISPTLLLGEAGKRFMVGALTLPFDLLSEWAVQALAARLLTNRNQPADALALLGQERLSPRYAIDTDLTYRARVHDAWERFRQIGSEQGMLAELAAYGLSGEIVFNDEWNWDSHTSEDWSRFWVVLYEHPWTPPLELGDPGLVLDGTWTLGSNATPEEVDTVRKIVRRWKPGHMRCSHIILVFDEATWASEQPDGTWDVPHNRSASACYWPG